MTTAERDRRIQSVGAVAPDEAAPDRTYRSRRVRWIAGAASTPRGIEPALEESPDRVEAIGAAGTAAYPRVNTTREDT
jgi:hypothetical protein